MKAYLFTTGTVFGLITLAHLARVYFEHGHLVHDPAFIILTLLSAGLCFWGFRLLATLSRQKS